MSTLCCLCGQDLRKGTTSLIFTFRTRTQALKQHPTKLALSVRTMPKNLYSFCCVLQLMQGIAVCILWGLCVNKLTTALLCAVASPLQRMTGTCI